MNDAERDAVRLKHSQSVELWMAEWIQGGSHDWSLVPDDLEDACRFDTDVNEVIAQAITRFATVGNNEVTGV